MTQTCRWIGTTGGPHVLVAKELLSLWRGIEGWRDHRDPADQSDYARACRATTWLKLVPLGEGHAIVLSGDVGDIAWFPNSAGDGGFLIQWLGIDDETLIATLLGSEAISNKLASADAEKIEFKTGSSGTMWLFDASEPGDNLKGSHQILALRPGIYQMRAAYFCAPGLMTVVRELLLHERVAIAE